MMRNRKVTEEKRGVMTSECKMWCSFQGLKKERRLKVAESFYFLVQNCGTDGSQTAVVPCKTVLTKG